MVEPGKIKILLIGAGGLIGNSITGEMEGKYDWKGTYYSRGEGSYLRCDIMSPEDLQKIFAVVRPTHVIHCANLAGGLDFCQRNPGLAKKFHYDGTVNIGRCCLEAGARFIFISTECIFDGKKEFYNEDDSPSPLSVYGKFKAKSEEWIAAYARDYIIVRTMSVYGWDPRTLTPNALMKLYSSILKKEKVYAPTFRWGSPTLAKDLARAILELCLCPELGIFHLAGSTYLCRYEWLKRTCLALGWDESLVIPQDKPSSADGLRPGRIRLNTEKFKKRFFTVLHDLNEGLSLLKYDIEAQKVKAGVSR